MPALPSDEKVLIQWKQRSVCSLFFQVVILTSTPQNGLNVYLGRKVLCVAAGSPSIGYKKCGLIAHPKITFQNVTQDGSLIGRVFVPKIYLPNHSLPAPERCLSVAFHQDGSGLEMSALDGNRKDQYLLARAYDMGLGVELSKSKSFQWLLASAQQGFEPAEYLVSSCYGRGIEGVVEKSEVKAIFWLKRAANRGYALAEYFLGVWYYGNLGVEQSNSEAEIWLKRAAGRGCAPAQTFLNTWILPKGDVGKQQEEKCLDKAPSAEAVITPEKKPLQDHNS
jgi:TPR repeat protein